MSWGTNTSGEVHKGSIDPAVPQLSDDVAEEQGAQFEAALDAARKLAAVVGRPDDPVTVTLHGHANPGHGPRTGWANETVTVVVSACPTE